MATAPETRATLDDLMKVDGKAELVGGRIVTLMSSGEYPILVTGNIYVALREFARRSGRGFARTDSLGYAVRELPSGRESFAPDVSYCDWRPEKRSMKFVTGPPTFAVEVRNERDYGARAERELRDKRHDYFAAGTLVVWDVDPVNQVVRVYRRDQPDAPTERRLGDTADAEPAVPGWTMTVDEVFADD